MYSAIDVAKYIIWYCKRQGYRISNLKLQKILYFVQASFLVNQGNPCFFEDQLFQKYIMNLRFSVVEISQNMCAKMLKSR